MGLMKKLTSAVVASSLVLGLVGTAFAAPSAEQNQKAFDVLSKYNIVQGVKLPDGTVDPALGDTLTRAQLVTIIVRAFGQDDTAKLLAGAASFSDVNINEWYSGYAALAKNIAAQKGISIGYEDGSFKPSQNVTMIEALAFVMKFLGVAPGTGANWVADTVAAAKEAGIITAADAEAYLAEPNAPATRGNAFGLAYSIFSTYQVTPGETVLTSYVDTTGPVLTLNKPAEPTTTGATLTVTGKASDFVTLYNGTEQITANADGSFTAEVKLEVGPNTIAISAVDLAGNTTTESFSITRNVGAAAAIKAELSSTTVGAGGEVSLTLAVVDANGAAVEANADDITITPSGSVASVDKVTGKVVAGTTAGAGTITVSYGDLAPVTLNVTVSAGELSKVVADATAVAPGTSVKLVAQDAYGNAIEGATFSEESSDAFIEGTNFVATKSGQYTVTASKDGKSATGTIGVFGSVAKTAIETPSVMVANDKTQYTLTVKVVDSEGNLVSSADKNIRLDTPAGFTAINHGGTKAAKNGVATFVYTIDPGLADADLTLTSWYDSDGDGFEATDKKGTLVVTPAPQVATKISVEAGDEYLATDDVDNMNTITVKVLDQADKQLTSGTWEMDVAVTGPAVLENGGKTDSIPLGNGSTFNILPDDAGAAGNITVTVSFAGLTTGTTTVKAAMPGVATALKLTESEDAVKADAVGTAADNGNAVTYTLVAVDRNGVPTTTDAPTAVTVTLDSDLNAVHAFYAEGVAALAPIGGVGGEGVTHTFNLATGPKTFKVAASKVGTYDVAATATNYSKVSDSFTVNATSPKVVALTQSVVDLLRASESSAVATAQLYDKFGNPVTNSGVSVKFQADSYTGVKLDGKGEAVKALTDEKGQAKVTVALRSDVGAANITLDDGDTEDLYNLVNVAGASDWLEAIDEPSDTLAINVVNEIADSITGSIIAEGDATKVLRTITADGYDDDTNPATEAVWVQLSFTVKSNFGDPVTGLAADAAAQARNFKLSTSVTGLDLSGVTITETATAGTYETSPIVWHKAGTVDLNVEVISVAKELKLSRSFTVVPGAVSNVALAEGTDGVYGDATSTQKLSVEKNKVTKLTVQVTDAYGNPVSATNNRETVRVYFDKTGFPAEKYISFRNGDGAEISYAEIKAGRNSATFYVVTDGVGTDETFDLEAYTKGGTEWNGPATPGAGDSADTLIGTLTATIK